MPTDEPTPAAPASFSPRLSGHCACCGAETRSLFAMGHDARFRGQLQRTLAAGSWDNRVSWFVDGETSLGVTVTDALTHVARLIGRDWTDKVVAGASRLAKRPVTAAPSRPTLPPAEQSGRMSQRRPSTSEFVPTDTTEERIDRLMAKLGRPMAGKWGWLTIADLTESVSTSPHLGEQVAGRVERTHRDPELEPTAWHLDVFVPTMRKTFVDVSPSHFRVDERARDAG